MLRLIDKYKPKNLDQVIGNEKSIKNLKISVMNNSTIMLTGNHGIGKSLVIDLILKELDYEPYIVTSSNIKNDKNFYRNIVRQQCTNLNQIIDIKKSAIVVLDIENITIKGEKEIIIDMINKNLSYNILPVIFLTNEQHSSFKKILLKKKGIINIIFSIPETKKIMEFFNNITELENIKIDKKNIKNVVIFASYDMRKIFQVFEDLKFLYNGEEITSEKLEEYKNTSYHHSQQKSLEREVRYVLENFLGVIKIEEFYSKNKVLFPLTIRENYYNNVFARKCNKKETYQLLSDISNKFSEGEMIEKGIYTEQNWYFQEIYGFLTCVNPSYLLNKYNLKTSNYEIKLARDNTKKSVKSKSKKKIQDLIKTHFNTKNEDNIRCDKNIEDMIIISTMLKKLYLNDKYNKIKDISNCYNLNEKMIANLVNLEKTEEIEYKPTKLNKLLRSKN